MSCERGGSDDRDAEYRQYGGDRRPQCRDRIADWPSRGGAPMSWRICGPIRSSSRSGSTSFRRRRRRARPGPMSRGLGRRRGRPQRRSRWAASRDRFWSPAPRPRCASAASPGPTSLVTCMGRDQHRAQQPRRQSRRQHQDGLGGTGMLPDYSAQQYRAFARPVLSI